MAHVPGLNAQSRQQPWSLRECGAALEQALWAFEPGAAAAWSRLRAARPGSYARSRNHLEGAVTRLSPYLSHGYLELAEALRELRRLHGLGLQHKLVQELGWRAYFRHAWRHLGERMFDSLHTGPLPEAAYARALPPDVRGAATGVPAIDCSVRTLYAGGYLHNHARMWLASYLVHVRKVHWRCGADWMWAHLLDGDLASNHLSWQWVAGTGSSKPYVFNASNVARHAPPAWHSPGTVIDASYEDLWARAFRAGDAGPEPGRRAGVAEPALHANPPLEAGFHAPDAGRLDGLDVWVVHPWCLADVPRGFAAVAVLDLQWHARHPWSALRWGWVLRRMHELAPLRWAGSGAVLAQALRGARSLRGRADPHLPWLRTLPGLAEPASGFAEPARHAPSFSAWWRGLRGFTADAGCNLAFDFDSPNQEFSS